MHSMNEYKNYAILIAVMGICPVLLWNCSFDKAEMTMLQCEDEVTYQNTVKPIIDGSCAYNGCHDGSSEAPGNFTNYGGMLNWLQNDLFEQRVIINRDMPPADATGPTELSSEQIRILRCWLQDGYPID